MKNEKYIYLIYQQLQGALTPEEENVLNEWLASSAENQKIRDDIAQSMDALDDYEPKFPIDLDKDYAEMRKKMDIPEVQSEKVVSLFSRRVWLMAAAAISLLIAIIFWTQKSPSLETEWIALQTTKGELQQISLPDGSEVWLNENSELIYPEAFSEEKRLVKLSGEGFFEITKNETQPFLIETSKTAVEVLGTSFNVRAYEDEPQTSVTVKTGKVKFETIDKQTANILTRHQSAVLTHDDQQMEVYELDNLNALAWQNKTLSFKGTPLNEVIPTLEKHFNIKITFDNPDLANCPYSMTPREASLNKILDEFKDLYKVKIEELAPDSFLIRGGNCK